LKIIASFRNLVVSKNNYVLIIAMLFIQLLQFSVFTNVCSGQSDQVKFMAYNLLNYGGTSGFVADTTLRNPYYRTSINSENPDILVVEELNSQAGLNSLLTKVLNSQSISYSVGTFIDGPDSDNGVFFKTSKFKFVSNYPIITALRNISEFTLVHLASGDTLRIYAVHLKASSGLANENLRSAEVDSLRKRTDALPNGSKFIVCGDFNFYSSTESPYLKLLQVHPNVEGHFVDPVNLTGIWNNSAYAIYHTQSTRGTRAFGGGSTGGLDDRFDLILYSKAIQLGNSISYVSNSLKVLGNDGNHYNDSINKMPNTAVTQQVAEALYQASDHLPVMSTFNFNYGTTDVGVVSFINPVITPCSNTNKSLIVSLKNFSNYAIDFSSKNVQIVLTATNPNSIIQTFNVNISSGSLLSNSSRNVLVDNTYNMTLPGIYTFSAHSVSVNDIIASNDAMPVVSQNVNPSNSIIASVLPVGPLSICSGASTILTASTGVSYLWSNGATTSSVSVSLAGNYTVTVTDAFGCTSISNTVAVSIFSGISSGIVFHENMGSSPSTTLIPAYEIANGFESDNLTMSGSADVRNTSASSGYADASALGNVFITSTVGKNFIISNINTAGLTGLELSFAINRNNLTGADLTLKISTDGINYTVLSYPNVSTTAWTYRTALGTIPSTPNLYIQFIQEGTTTQFRIDDVVLKYANVTSIIATGPTIFCKGDSVLLTSTTGANYLWNTGATTQSIYSKTSGNYSVITNCISSPIVVITVNICTIELNVQTLIQGFYNTQTHTMSPLLFNLGLSTDTTTCDSITIELYSSGAVTSLMFSKRALLHIDGTATVDVPIAFNNQQLYIVIRHRNSIETWSKTPTLFTGLSVNKNFTQ